VSEEKPMTKMKDLLPIFEQTAARRAQASHGLKVKAALAPMAEGLLTDAHCMQIDEACAHYEREHRRHEAWLQRRFESAGIG